MCAYSPYSSRPSSAPHTGASRDAQVHQTQARFQGQATRQSAAQRRQAIAYENQQAYQPQTRAVQRQAAGNAARAAAAQPYRQQAQAPQNAAYSRARQDSSAFHVYHKPEEARTAKKSPYRGKHARPEGAPVQAEFGYAADEWRNEVPHQYVARQRVPGVRGAHARIDDASVLDPSGKQQRVAHVAQNQQPPASMAAGQPSRNPGTGQQNHPNRVVPTGAAAARTNAAQASVAAAQQRRASAPAAKHQPARRTESILPPGLGNQSAEVFVRNRYGTRPNQQPRRAAMPPQQAQNPQQGRAAVSHTAYRQAGQQAGSAGVSAYAAAVQSRGGFVVTPHPQQGNRAQMQGSYAGYAPQRQNPYGTGMPNGNGYGANSIYLPEEDANRGVIFLRVGVTIFLIACFVCAGFFMIKTFLL